MKQIEYLKKVLFDQPNYQYGILVSPDCLGLKEPFIKALHEQGTIASKSIETPLVVGSDKIGYSYGSENDIEKLLNFDYLNGLSLEDILSYHDLYCCDEHNRKILFFVMYDSIKYKRNKQACEETNFFARYICAIDLSVCSQMSINEVLENHFRKCKNILSPSNQKRADYFILKYVDSNDPFEKVK